MSLSEIRLPQLLMRREGFDGLPDVPVLEGLTLRAAHAGDEEGLARLLEACFGSPWTLAGVRSALTANAQVDRVYVITPSAGAVGGAETGSPNRGEIIATASARMDEASFPGAGYLHWVAVSPAWRARRLGLAVCLKVMDRFRELGLRATVLETDDHRVPAIRMYLGMGFLPVLRHPADEGRWNRVMDALTTAKE